VEFLESNLSFHFSSIEQTKEPLRKSESRFLGVFSAEFEGQQLSSQSACSEVKFYPKPNYVNVANWSTPEQKAMAIETVCRSTILDTKHSCLFRFSYNFSANQKTILRRG
jgi:hypothetical protein